MLINLDKYDERSQMTSDTVKLPKSSAEHKYLAGASLHPPEGCELMTSPSHIRLLHLVHFNYPKSLCNQHKEIT
jgi:hypothetical protein